MAKDVYFNLDSPMISGIGEVQERVFKEIKGKKGKRWFVAVQNNEADNIYVETTECNNGFCGRKMKFKLQDGSIVTAIGPWHSNSGALYKDTGYDCRNKHLTYGIVAKERIYVGGQTKYVNVVFVDTEFTLGSFNRIDDIAQFFANKFGQRIYYAVKTMGGGRSSYCDPIKENNLTD